MNPFALFLLAIFSPLMLAATLLLPTYVSIAGASYIIYYDSKVKVHPLEGKLDQVFYMIDVYGNLFSRWSQDITHASITGYTLPLILLPLLGVSLSLLLTAKLSRKLHDTFRANH